jgi:hypothetical protein
MNLPALAATFIFALVFLCIYYSVYRGALKNFNDGSLSPDGIRLFKVGLIGHLIVYFLIALSTLFA